MKRYRILLLIICLPQLLPAQREKLLVQCDKEVAYAGDTVWFSVNVLRSRKVSSSVVHAELFTQYGQMMKSYLFNSANGLSFGQVPCPKDTGHYQLRFYTMQSDNVKVPLTIRGHGQDFAVIRSHPDTPCPMLLGGLLAIKKDTGGYYVQKLRKEVDYYSVTVSDTSQPFHFTHASEDPAPEYIDDSNMLSYTYKARATGKNAKNISLAGRELSLIFNLDGLRTVLLEKIDSAGEIKLDSMEFFDSAAIIQYQLNHEEKNLVTLEPVRRTRSYCLPDESIVDSFHQPYVNLPGMAGVKALDTAYVKVNYQRRNDGIHNRLFQDKFMRDHFKYVFIAGFDFDKEPPGKWDQNLRDYFRHGHRFPRLAGRVQWVIDGMEATGQQVLRLDLASIRYVDFEDYHVDGSVGYIAYGIICLRHGEDALNLPDHITYVRPQGFTRVVPWTTPDRSTKMWIPYTSAERVYIAKGAPFKVTLVAFLFGYPFFFEQTVEE